ncbi:MAG: hypothetical protein F7B60_05625 [Desulfurococcales archaeon]|nr:hypothetical protein [Desulfurococcales archaeon]
MVSLDPDTIPQPVRRMLLLRLYDSLTGKAVIVTSGSMREFGEYLEARLCPVIWLGRLLMTG